MPTLFLVFGEFLCIAVSVPRQTISPRSLNTLKTSRKRRPTNNRCLDCLFKLLNHGSDKVLLPLAFITGVPISFCFRPRANFSLQLYHPHQTLDVSSNTSPLSMSSGRRRPSYSFQFIPFLEVTFSHLSIYILPPLILPFSFSLPPYPSLATLVLFVCWVDMICSYLMAMFLNKPCYGPGRKSSKYEMEVHQKFGVPSMAEGSMSSSQICGFFAEILSCVSDFAA